jgi:hypothetical protein
MAFFIVTAMKTLNITLAFDITQTESVWEQGAEENMWTEEG